MMKLLMPVLLLCSLAVSVQAQSNNEDNATVDENLAEAAINDSNLLNTIDDATGEESTLDFDSTMIYPPRHYPRHPRYPRRPHRPPYRPPYRPAGNYITCSSNNYAYNECYAGGYIYRADVSNQISRSSCSYGYSWGYTSDRIWVAHGCRATFWVELGY